MTDQHSANPLDQKLGVRIRTRRLACGMSPERLADAVGISVSELEACEQGAARIDARLLFDMTIVLDAPLADETPASSAAAHAAAPSPVLGESPEVQGGAELLRLYTAMPSGRLRQRVIDVVRAIGGKV